MSAALIADKLRASLLQAAIQGKLTKQLAEDGDARDLLKEIEAEKARLIEEKIIKKEKPLPPITDEEIPFEIPENWVWVRIGEVTIINPKNKIDDELDVGFIPMAHISDGYRNEFIYDVKKWKDIKKGFTHFANNDLVIAKITPCFQNRKSAVLQGLPNNFGAGTTELHVIRVIENLVNPLYLLYLSKSNAFINNGVANFTGTAGQQRIGKDFVAQYLLPLPPLSEQHRIVEAIEIALAKIDKLKTDETKLDDIQKAFPNKLRASLLQSAIQGQLTEQLPEDGNARDLLKEIEAEKARLIEEKIIKKEKPLPPITEEEIPFEIPENWAWVRLGDLSIFINGDRSANYPTEKDFVPTGIPFFGAKDMIRNQLGYNPNLRFISEEKFKSLRSGKLQHLDFVCLLRGSIGKYAFFPKNEKFDTGFINAQMVIIRALHIEMVHYFESLFKSYYFESFIKEASSGTAVKQLAAETLRALMIPLPPLAEQERIVKKLDEILGKVDGLKKITQ